MARASDEVRRLAQGISRMEERADAVAAKIEGLRSRLHRGRMERPGERRGDRLGQGPGADPERLLRIKRELVRQRQFLAARGTGEFALAEEGGKYFAHINGKRVPLSPTQAVLLAVLAQDNGHGDDELVGWKTSREVAEEVSRRMGKLMRRGALRQNILRLRQRLERFGVDRYLVQSRGSQLRFALRRSASAAGGRRVVDR